MEPAFFFDLLKRHQLDFFAGVPDSLLKAFCAYVSDHTEKKNQVICANEGAAVAIACGHYLATGEIGSVYLQNSGLGNAINPLLSMADPEVMGIPLLLLIGWRGEPGKKDEPQHRKQGKVTLPLLEAMGIPYSIIGEDEDGAKSAVEKAVSHMRSQSSAYALVVRSGAFLDYQGAAPSAPGLTLLREEALEVILAGLDDEDIVVSTTGMASREVFELREKSGAGHDSDLLIIGGMGHASQFALGIALEKPDRKVLCLDGDGSCLMHMGSMAINGSMAPGNFAHIVINNGAHASVGGQPTAGFSMDFTKVAQAVGYESVFRAQTREEIDLCMRKMKTARKPFFLEVRIKLGFRRELGRPTVEARDNKKMFMRFLGAAADE